MKDYRIFVVNPGSTSTKVGLFEGEKKIFSSNVSHDAEELKKFTDIMDQLPYRVDTINKELKTAGIKLEHIDACVGRGGGLMPVEGGTYRANELMLDHARRGANGVIHPAQLGIPIATAFAEEFHCPVFAVNPPDVDEYEPIARITGIKGVYRQSHLHSLNLKETAIRHSKLMGVKYEDCNYIVCHIGGGISISAHHKGRMIDGNDIVTGEGPMAPTRCGEVPVSETIKLCSAEGGGSVKQLCLKNGGLVSHLDTSDAREVLKMIEHGDKYAELIWDAMIYQITKYIGAMASVLKGDVDAILLGGGLVYSEDLVCKIKESCSYLAPVYAYPGEFEMEAMASGAIRVLTGEEKAKVYTAEPVWKGLQD